MEIVDTLGFLLGSWRVQRRIEDHQSGISGSFSGVATFTQLSRGDASRPEKQVRFYENGELSFGAFRLPFRTSEVAFTSPTGHR
ncbi:MAG: DUF6314 family protein [Acidimicrobiales bacterium]